MLLLAVYDPVTKEVVRRVRLSNADHAKHYPNHVVLTPQEFESEPELTKRVDLKSKSLVAK